MSYYLSCEVPWVDGVCSVPTVSVPAFSLNLQSVSDLLVPTISLFVLAFLFKFLYNYLKDF